MASSSVVDIQEQMYPQPEFTLASNRSRRESTTPPLVVDGSEYSREEIIGLNLIMEGGEEHESSSSYPSFSFATPYDFDYENGSRSGAASNESESPLFSPSSSDLMNDESDDEDDSFSSASPDNSTGSGSLFDLSELMSQLPIKRGLSKFYAGKSQSFKSLARVTSLEDLAKSSTTSGGYGKRIKACKSYAAGLSNTNKSSRLSYSPKATISKKSPSSLSCSRNNRFC